MRPTRNIDVLVAVLGLVLASACVSPFNPEAGFPSPVSPGTVIVRVVDQAGSPVAGVFVYVEQPNSIGGTFRVGRVTAPDGRVTFKGVPAGDRRVELQLPAGVSAGADGVTRTVTVVESRETSIQFTVIR